MTLKVPNLPAGTPIVDSTGAPTTTFIHWWQNAISNIVATINQISRVTSHTNPTTILSAKDDGTSCTVTISDHVRVFGDGSTLAITGGVIRGLVSNVAYAFYYDDPTMANTAPTFVATQQIKVAQAVSAPSRYFLGIIYTPAAGSGATTIGGGAYPVGSSIGGEL